MLDNLRNIEKIRLQHTQLQNIAEPTHQVGLGRWWHNHHHQHHHLHDKNETKFHKRQVSITIHCLKWISSV